MKTNNIVKGISFAAAALLLPACASDYLDLEPQTTVSTAEVTRTVEAAQLAINGICNAMQTQYQSTSYNQYNGESYVNTLLGDALGQDYISGLGGANWGAITMRMGSTWDNERYVFQYIPWSYCYNLINQANTVIAGIDDAEGDEEERNFVKGEAYTFRAFAYTKLMMYYGPRWEDSDNGNTYVAVLRTEPSIKDVPLCTMNAVMDLIYSDLDTAIEAFQASGTTSRDYKWQPDLSIAYGVYTRAALIKNDWAKAQTMAHNARQGYTIMDNDTYLSGFCYDNNDFMWIQASEPSDIYYWSYGSHYSANGTYVNNWGLGAGAIDKSLFDQLDENDIRRQCYLMPENVDKMPSAYNPGKLKAEDWWNPELVDGSNICNMAIGAFAKKDAGKSGKWGLYNIALRYSKWYGENVFVGDYNSMKNEDYWNYYKTGNSGKVLLSKGVYGTLVPVPFGAQYKFWSIPPYGVSAYPYMRASEMCLAEAEAAYHNGDVATAQKCLNEINGKRIPGYTCSSTGQALLDEIRLCRRIELWGEGQNWTDFKRWNLPINRVPWVATDLDGKPIEGTQPGQGNWIPDYAGKIETNIHYGWRMLVPNAESEYNHAVDRNLLPK